MEECQALRSTPNLYERASGQAINYSKSGILYNTNVTPAERVSLSDILGISRPLNTRRYLGLPTLIGRNKSDSFRHIKDRLWSKLQHWRNKKLSKAEKEVLLKFAAQAIPAYCMSTFLLPPPLLDDLEKMMNSFWWGHGSDPKKGIKWEAWDSLCKHKSDGGMIRNLYVFNVAMLGKLGWRLLNNPESLVSRILKAKYFPSTDFLSAQLGYNPSYTWRSIHEARDLIRRGTRWKVGGGESVRIWDCPRVDNDNSFLISTTPVPTFEDMVVNDLFIPGTRVWDRELIDEVFSPGDRDAILKTTPAPMGCEDRLIWHFAANGKYSVKMVYILAMRLINNGPPRADAVVHQLLQKDVYDVTM